MATYKQVQEWVKDHYGFAVRPCWIAHAKELNGLKLKRAHNRYDPKFRLDPCPDDKLSMIREAFEYFHMV